MKERILEYLRMLAVSNISLYDFVRRRIALLDFMLPHDEAFFGLAKFGDGEGLFLDIGANDGVSARSYRKLIKNRPILSIEANPLHVASLTKTREKIEAFEFKVMGADKSFGEVILYTPIFKNIALTNYASVDEEAARANLSTHMRIRDIGNRVTFERTEVETKPIDSLDIAPEIVKIDVEGYEANVIEGMQETIRRCLPVIMLEYNPVSFAKVRETLGQYDYALKSYDRVSDSFCDFDLNAPPLNAFFLPPRII